MYLCIMRRGVCLLVFLVTSVSLSAQTARIAFWNVENFFDTQDDHAREDDAFTPQGECHWTPKRYADKRDKIYKMVASLNWPDAVGVAEVESDQCLRDLCQGTPLRKAGYGFVHYDSPDARGVDCALLYRKESFLVIDSKPIYVSDTLSGFYTRDILMVVGVLHGTDTCCLFVNHWPSKLGGAEADTRRLQIARILREMMDSLRMVYPSALILAMGDFNSALDEEAFVEGFGMNAKTGCAGPWHGLMHSELQGTGSYKYQDTWSFIDQFISNRELTAQAFMPEFMLVDDKKYMGKKLFRTYLGMRYLGGYSDHLPIYVDVK